MSDSTPGQVHAIAGAVVHAARLQARLPRTLSGAPSLFWTLRQISRSAYCRARRLSRRRARLSYSLAAGGIAGIVIPL
jgi:hypothetical protein